MSNTQTCATLKIKEALHGCPDLTASGSKPFLSMGRYQLRSTPHRVLTRKTLTLAMKSTLLQAEVESSFAVTRDGHLAQLICYSSQQV